MTGYLARTLGPLAVGALLGSSVLDWVDVPLDSLAGQLVFTLGVALILFHGGLHLSLPVLRRVWPTLALLSVPGVLLTAAVVGVAAQLAFGFPWELAFLAGAVLAPTDPALLIPLFLGSRFEVRLSQTVIAESALNDTVGATLAVALAGVVVTGSGSVAGPVGEFLLDLVVSTAIGVAAGAVLAAALATKRAAVWRESSAFAVLAGVALTYFSADSAGGSGYLGAFLAGLIVGNAPHLGFVRGSEEHVEEVGGFAARASAVVTVLVFLVLGANLPFAELADQLGRAVAVLAALMLVARPLTVLACALPDRSARWTREEILFLCWTRETGVVPAALVGVLAGLGVPDVDVLAAVVALAIVVTVLLQALPARRLADRLGLLES